MRPYAEIFTEPKFENIPDDLKSLPWAVWIAEPRSNKPGKFNKAPRNPKSGHKIGADKPEFFGTYDEAVAAFNTRKYTGVGILLTGNGLIGIDIDDARQTLRGVPGVKKWLMSARVAGAYCELSPSGTGLRLFFRDEPLPGTGRKSDNLEIYDDKRFLTVTGHTIPAVGAQ